MYHRCTEFYWVFPLAINHNGDAIKLGTGMMMKMRYEQLGKRLPNVNYLINIKLRRNRSTQGIGQQVYRVLLGSFFLIRPSTITTNSIYGTSTEWWFQMQYCIEKMTTERVFFVILGRLCELENPVKLGKTLNSSYGTSMEWWFKMQYPRLEKRLRNEFFFFFFFTGTPLRVGKPSKTR